MSEEKAILCQEMNHLAVLHACDELEAPARVAVEEHAASCAECAALLERERALLETVAARPVPEPTAVELLHCRGALSDALDELSPKSAFREFLDSLRPKKWFALHPAWGAAFCLLLGVTVGFGVPRWLEQASPVDSPSEDIVRANVPVSDQDFQNLGVSGITVIPSLTASGSNVEFQMRRAEPFVVRGTVDDQQVRNMLMHVLQSRQFDSGLRMDSLDALRPRAANEDVRRALCQVLRTDRNTGVRLKAAEALRGQEKYPEVRQALLDALHSDENAGVRVEAINALRALMEASPQGDEQLMKVFRDRMQNDSNAYIRLQSAAVVREVAARPRN